MKADKPVVEERKNNLAQIVSKPSCNCSPVTESNPLNDLLMSLVKEKLSNDDSKNEVKRDQLDSACDKEVPNNQSKCYLSSTKALPPGQLKCNNILKARENEVKIINETTNINLSVPSAPSPKILNEETPNNSQYVSIVVVEPPLTRTNVASPKPPERKEEIVHKSQPISSLSPWLVSSEPSSPSGIADKEITIIHRKSVITTQL